MNPFETLAELIETSKSAIARETAETAIASQLPAYALLSVDDLARFLEPTIEMMAHYVRAGDPLEYRDYIRNLTQTRLAHNYTSAEIVTMGQILTGVLKTAVMEAFGDEAHTRELAAFQRRLDGIQTLTQSTVIATRSFPGMSDQ